MLVDNRTGLEVEPAVLSALCLTYAAELARRPEVRAWLAIVVAWEDSSAVFVGPLQELLGAARDVARTYQAEAVLEQVETDPGPAALWVVHVTETEFSTFRMRSMPLQSGGEA